MGSRPCMSALRGCRGDLGPKAAHREAAPRTEACNCQRCLLCLQAWRALGASGPLSFGPSSPAPFCSSAIRSLGTASPKVLASCPYPRPKPLPRPLRQERTADKVKTAMPALDSRTHTRQHGDRRPTYTCSVRPCPDTNARGGGGSHSQTQCAWDY